MSGLPVTEAELHAYVDDLLKKTPLRIDQPTLEALRAQMKK